MQIKHYIKKESPNTYDDIVNVIKNIIKDIIKDIIQKIKFIHKIT